MKASATKVCLAECDKKGRVSITTGHNEENLLIVNLPEYQLAMRASLCSVIHLGRQQWKAAVFGGQQTHAE